MDKSVLLIGALGFGAYFLTKKKATIPATKEQKEQKEKEKEEIKEEKKYLTLTPSRIILIDQELIASPLKFELDVQIPAFANFLDYAIWAENNPKGIYQDWLTSMLYMQIVILEKRWDAETGELPLLLECGKKVDIAQLGPPPVYDIVVFPETPQECEQRLHQGRVLWLDINAYVKDEMTMCPQGAFCG